MNLFEEIYSALKKLSKDTEDKTKEINERIDQKNYKEENGAFSKLKTALKDFGYLVGSKGNTKVDKANAKPITTERAKGADSTALINTLVEMDNDFRKNETGVDISAPNIPSSLNLTQKEYDKKSVSDLKKEAESELLPAYESKVNALEESYQKEMNDLLEKEQTLEATTQEEKEKLEESYLENAQNHRDKMIFQGLVHSTINSSGIDNLKAIKDNVGREIDSQYDRKLNAIKNSRAECEVEFQNKMEVYDLNYCADLQEKISKLKDKEIKRLEEINEYNLEVREREREYQEARQQTLVNLRSEREKALFDEMARDAENEKVNGVSEAKRLEYKKRGEMARAFYQNFSVEDATALIEESLKELTLLLGTDELFELLEWNARR